VCCDAFRVESMYVMRMLELVDLQLHTSNVSWRL